jgi:3-hydroxyacyl-[acyl-carrier-protein] dehydratase
MLSGDFFNIQSVTFGECNDNQQKCFGDLALNADHPIYKGHFPGNPVVPGVCQIQMVKELAENCVQRPLNLKESDNVKFLLMINPIDNPLLDFEMLVRYTGESQISVSASIASGASVFLKFKGKFEFAE